eukprot:TRINITY_DN3744_c0_g1_i2.p1 TRINITY_DN3744_c0_g1~~TRINITY_DN3744_c0_g1_i2.p1  ORF type:complete len:296 (-),score=42.59 TRINITY_DN3744_c0_g1_i2:101-988(-)
MDASAVVHEGAAKIESGAAVVQSGAAVVSPGAAVVESGVGVIEKGAARVSDLIHSGAIRFSIDGGGFSCCVIVAFFLAAFVCQRMIERSAVPGGDAVRGGKLWGAFSCGALLLWPVVLMFVALAFVQERIMTAMPDNSATCDAACAAHNSMENRMAELGEALIPQGAILAWHPKETTYDRSDRLVAPDGYEICDGKHGTPDLMGKFILGASAKQFPSSYQMKKDGGTTSHMHSTSTKIAMSSRGASGWGAERHETYADSKDAVQYGNLQDQTFSGSASSVSHMPPYHTLVYIMKK